MLSAAVCSWMASPVPVYTWPQIIIIDSLCSIGLITRKSLLIKRVVRFYTLLTLLHYSVSVAQLQLMGCLSFVTSLTFFHSSFHNLLILSTMWAEDCMGCTMVSRRWQQTALDSVEKQQENWKTSWGSRCCKFGASPEEWRCSERTWIILVTEQQDDTIKNNLFLHVNTFLWRKGAQCRGRNLGKSIWLCTVFMILPGWLRSSLAVFAVNGVLAYKPSLLAEMQYHTNTAKNIFVLLFTSPPFWFR